MKPENISIKNINYHFKKNKIEENKNNDDPLNVNKKKIKPKKRKSDQ